MSKNVEVAPNVGMDRSLFFITLSAVCVWLVVDVAIGKNYLGSFLATLFPFMNNGETAPRGEMTTEEVKQAENNAPSSSAIGSGRGSDNPNYGSNRANGNYSTNGQIVGDSYRKN